jgi:hypothetical protein
VPGADGASNSFVDPACPPVMPPPPEDHCDVFKPPPGDCPPGQGCYRSAALSTDKCMPTHWVADCAPEGIGKQGDACVGDWSCAGGFVCTGFGTCGQVCDVAKLGGCSDGMICESIQGLGDEGVCN